MNGTEATPATPGDGHRSGETILLVEDEPDIRDLVAGVLQDSGYHLLVAASGADGIERLRRHGTVSLLVTDIGLPGGMSGRQMADACRTLQPGLRTLFVTGYAGGAVGALEPGMELLAKPFRIDDLLARIRALLDQPG